MSSEIRRLLSPFVNHTDFSAGFSSAIVNASIDRQGPVTVCLRGVPADAKAAVWHQPEADDVEIALVRDGADARVRLPRIGAWECGYLSFK